MTACTDRWSPDGAGSAGFLVGGAEGRAEVWGDELPCASGEEEDFGDADPDGDAEVFFRPAGVADPLAEGVAKEIRPPPVSSSESVCP